jgi:hypothetical protein
MNLHHIALFLCPALATLAGCNLDNDTGTPDPGQYWGWVCPDGGGTPIEASAPIHYVASGTCGKGGSFSVSVDGCKMFGSWSALGLSNVETVQFTGSPGLGEWTVTATGGVADGGAPDAGKGPSWSCTAKRAAAGDLTFTCHDTTTSATTCESTLTPMSGRDADRRLRRAGNLRWRLALAGRGIAPVAAVTAIRLTIAGRAAAARGSRCR